jgi:hypothetical protein
MGSRSTLPVILLPPLMVVGVACSTTHAGSFRFSGEDMRQAFKSWREKTSPKTRTTLDALNEDEGLLIHVIRGKLDRRRSRGAASSPAWTPVARQQCVMHPKVEGIKPHRNWDVIYDQELQEEQERQTGLPAPSKHSWNMKSLGTLFRRSWPLL